MKTIKVSNPKTKTKFLVKAEYKNYLSVHIQQAIVDGENIYDYKKQLEKLKQFDLDLYNLCNFHLGKLGSVGNNYKSNAAYYAKLCRDQLGKTYYTREDHNEKLATLKAGLRDHKLFTVLSPSAIQIKLYIEDYLNESTDLFKYNDFSKSIDHWENQLIKAIGVYPYKNRVKVQLEQFFNDLQQYRDLQNKYKYKTLISSDDLWNCERLAEYLDCDIDQVFKVICSNSEENLKKELDLLLKSTIILREETLKALLNKYNLV